jgi:hypothetical protein
MKNICLEVWASWGEWITRGVYAHDELTALTNEEAKLASEGYKTRRMTY